MSHHIKRGTLEDLQFRANNHDDIGAAHDWLENEDYRRVTLYFEWGEMRGTDDGNFPTDDSYAELIGASLGEDDPSFPAEIWTRAQCLAMFGLRKVDDWEMMETERLMEWK